MLVCTVMLFLQGYVSKAANSARKLVAQVQAACAEAGAMVAQGAGLRRPRAKRIVERDLNKLRIFGFDKTAVLLCYSDELDRCVVVAALAGSAVLFLM